MRELALSDALAEAVGAGNCATGDAARPFSVDGVMPKAAVFPASCAEAAAVMRLAAERRLAVTPRGGGTMMAMGRPPERVDIVLGTRRLDRVLAHEVGDLTATVEAGVTLRRLEEALARHGQSLALDAPLDGRATIGGVLAANAAGPRRLGYGGPRDRLIGIRVVDARGTVIKAGGKVVKNVAGYDLNKMFIGSLGTLGFIVEATFKLAPLPPARAAIVGAFGKVEEAMSAAQAIRGGWCRPVALDLLNRAAFDEIAPRAGVPSMSDAQYQGVAALAGGAAGVERQKSDIHRAIVENGGKSMVVSGDPAYARFWRAVLDLGRQEDMPAPMITRCSILFSQVVPMVHGHEALADGGGLDAAIDVPLGSGPLRAFWSGRRKSNGETWKRGERHPVVDPTLLAETARTLRVAAGNAGGALVVESCPVSVKRALDVWGPVGSGMTIMERLKQQFDPDRLLSPGRFAGGL